MEQTERVDKIIKLLEEQYPEALCSLDFNREKPYELLFSVRLAAQCTDARVNIVSTVLYRRYQTLREIAESDINELSEIVKSCGFYKVKAQNIKETAGILLSKYNGVIPDTMEELLTLPGVGRKTANLILGDIYGQPAIVADTHCIRISNRLGLATGDDPTKVEFQLRKIIPPEKSNNFCHRLVLFGREFCMARSPRCKDCPLSDVCPSRKV